MASPDNLNARADSHLFRVGSIATGVTAQDLNPQPRPAETVSTPEFGSVLGVDPRALSFSDFQALTPLGRDQAILQLYRNGDEDSMVKVAELRPGFEMQYQLSGVERIAFRSFEDYIEGGVLVFDSAAADALGESGALDRLDHEKERRATGISKYPRPANILGFKLERFDRWRIEEQIRIEKEEAERKALELDSSALVKDIPKAA